MDPKIISALYKICTLWDKFYQLRAPKRIAKSVLWKTVLSGILVAGDTVAIPQVDVDVVPGVPGLAAAHLAHPLGGGHLGEGVS